MYSMNVTTTAQMPGVGFGSAGALRTITTPNIDAVTATSATVTALGTAVQIGDVLVVENQGIWGICTSEDDATEIVTVDRWLKITGQTITVHGILPVIDDDLIAYPRSVLACCLKTIVRSFMGDGAGIDMTVTDILGNTYHGGGGLANLNFEVRGPWTAVTGATSGGSLSFETFGSTDRSPLIMR